MADLTISASQVVFDTNAPRAQFTAGVALTAGQTVYLDATQQLALAQCDGTLLEAAAIGLVIGSANAGQPCLVATAGVITLGALASPVEGTFYVVSDTAGSIMPVTDLGTSTWYASLVGVGTSNNAIILAIFPSEQQVP